jgi:hypothetical protein
MVDHIATVRECDTCSSTDSKPPRVILITACGRQILRCFLI